MLAKIQNQRLPYSSQFLLIFLFCLFSVSLKTIAIDNPRTSYIQLEYAIFYMETEGEFIVPVEVDAPAIYSWSQPGKTIKGDIPKIWAFLEIPTNVEYSFTDIENSLLNHVGSKGWELNNLQITSVPIPSTNNFRTAYRYIFQRQK